MVDVAIIMWLKHVKTIINHPILDGSYNPWYGKLSHGLALFEAHYSSWGL